MYIICVYVRGAALAGTPVSSETLAPSRASVLLHTS